ncbi:MAG: FtsX-like permease family protein [Acidobacteriaceae bacterium]|nr:FtsX-like permease family protein [Acidobacteriaceae bacterium]MBV9763525.1 FtsX-like permease family protein [Acidobacteriaceae bacterium]
MNAGLLLFIRLIVRPLGREPIRTALTVFAVALGVAVVIAIDLAGRAAAGSFHSSLESLTGNTDLAITATGGIDQNILGTLVQLPYAFDFMPRIEDFASLNGKGEAVPLLGLDLIGHRGEQEFESGGPENAARELASGDPIWVGRKLGLHAGERVKLLVNDAMHEFTVAGVLKPRSGDFGENNVIVADIGLVQKVTGKTNKLDSIDVRVPPDHSIEYWESMLRKQLPSSVVVEPQGSRTEENRKMLAAFRWNLHVLSYIALVVGAFLIYNTISISVVRRRAEIGIVRALGATRSMVTGAFLAEALFLGLAGVACGIMIGRVMALGAVRLIGNTVQSLYVSSQPAPVQFTLSAVVTGICLGLGVSVLAALAPAMEASRVAPVEAMARGREEYVAAIRSRGASIWAVLMFLSAAALCQLPPVHRQPLFAYIAALLLIAGTAAAIPGLVAFFAGTADRVLERLFGVEALLALRSLRASLGRTSVLTAALATAVAMTASVGIMVGSFRETVWLWMDNHLEADFYLRPAGSSAADRHPTMSADIADRIQRLPGVAIVDRLRMYSISYHGLPAGLAGGEMTRTQNSSGTRFLPGEDSQAILSKLPTGDYAIVSEPFANKHNVHPGSELRIPLGGAERNFQVLGVYYDYSSERGFVLLDRATLLKYLPDPAVTNFAVVLKAGADPGQVRQEIDEVIGGRAVMVFSNSALRRGAIAVFDRTFRITYALEAVAVIVAVMGIAGALLAMVLDRRREFALLRFLGAARSQVRGIILCEAGLLGLFANGIGLVMGILLSLILIFVINKQSFGWTIQFHWPVALLLAALTGVYVATVLAGLYPARTAIRMNPIEVIHEE